MVIVLLWIILVALVNILLLGTSELGNQMIPSTATPLVTSLSMVEDVPHKRPVKLLV